MSIELKPGVYWVGVVDWELRHFHGHELSTHRGSTYNSYLIVDDKIALVDTVWGPFASQLVAHIAAIMLDRSLSAPAGRSRFLRTDGRAVGWAVSPLPVRRRA